MAQSILSGLSRFFNRNFVWVVLTGAVLGYRLPGFFLWVGEPVPVLLVSGSGSLIPTTLPVDGIIVGLGLIMFGMGMTLSFREFRRALRFPGRIGLGVFLQFLLMPLVAFVLVILFGLPGVVALGVILVGCCPGGTASNVIAYLADADVPLSVSVTLVSTLLAPLITPWLVWSYGQKLLGFYTGQVIEIPVAILVKAILIIVVPLLLGLSVKRVIYGEEQYSIFDDVFTLLSVVIISIIVGYVVATASVNKQLFASLFLFGPVILHNLAGLALGYGGARVFGFPLDSVRSLSIEVGMQNSGLAVALAEILRQELVATGRYGSGELAMMAVPAVLFSVWHNVTGPVLASRWSESR